MRFTSANLFRSPLAGLFTLSSVLFVVPCYAQPRGGPDHIAAFADTAVQVLLLASSARQYMVIERSGDLLIDSFNQQTATRRAISRLREARSLMTTYSKDSDSDIREAAKTFELACSGWIEALNQFLSLDEQILKAKTPEDLTPLISAGSKAAALADEATRIFPLGVAAVSHVLVDRTRTENGKTNRLRITTSQRNALAKSIQTLLSNEIRSGAKGGHATDVAPSLLNDFLNQNWKTADAP